LATQQGWCDVVRAEEARLSRAGLAMRWAGNALGRQSGLDLLSDLVLLNIPNPKLPCRPNLAGRTLQAAPCRPHLAGRTLQAAPCRPHLSNNLIFYSQGFIF